MTETTLTLESLIALLRQHNGTITHVDRGPLSSKFIATIPEERAISPFMFMAIQKALDLVDTKVEKDKTTRVYRLPS